MRKLVGVIMGGPSAERSVSIRSGNAVIHALKVSMRFEPLPIYISKNMKWESSGRVRFGKGNVTVGNKKIELVFLALHGRYGEDGEVQKKLEKLQIPYTGAGPEQSRVAYDKVLSKKVFIATKVPTPEYIIYKKGLKYGDVTQKLGSKVVVKPAREGSSFGVSIVNTPAQFTKAIKLASKFDRKILIERFIDGQEFTVGILDGKTLPIVLITPLKRKFFDYTSKYNSKFSNELVPARIEKKLQQQLNTAALKAYRALHLRHYARIDIRTDKSKNVYVLEANTLPGLTNESLIPKAAQAAGIEFTKLIEILLKKAQGPTNKTGRA